MVHSYSQHSVYKDEPVFLAHLSKEQTGVFSSPQLFFFNKECFCTVFFLFFTVTLNVVECPQNELQLTLHSSYDFRSLSLDVNKAS